ncbi:MAG: fluoride efflux transporter CrcB [Spirochaetes bacterium]|nr:fluoride efflux transporter CrcB [Spirochaetota bacterium]
MKHLLFIALGGGLGAVSRYLVSKNIQQLTNQIIPFGTLFVNAAGSFIIGFFFYFFDNITVSRDIRSLITIGFLGAFTTFSTYSLETINLLRNGEIKLGITNFLLNNIICFIMVVLGILTSRFIIKIIK